MLEITMTRINIGIKPSLLSQKHLLAEHREIKRIPNTIRTGKARIEGIPEHFTLGKGHVKFFYDKLLYLFNRYQEIHSECIKRGFSVTDYSMAWSGVPQALMNDYQPTADDISVIMGRLVEKDREYYSQI